MSELRLRQRRKDARPAELIAAALDVFGEKGFAGARLEDIAQRAGVSKGTLYLYFDGKESLFKAMILTTLVPVIEEAESLADSLTDDPVTLMRELLLGWWSRVGRTKLAAIPKLIVAESGNFPDLAQFYFDHVIQRGRTLVINAYESGVRQGVFLPFDPQIACQLAMAPLLMACIWRESLAPCEPHGMSDYEAYVQRHVEIFLNGLQKPR